MDAARTEAGAEPGAAGTPGGRGTLANAEVERAIELLWPRRAAPELQVYALVDGARDPRIIECLRRGLVDRACLFAGRVHPRLERAAPHLAALGRGSPLTRELLALGFGRSWGMYLRSGAILQDVRRHLRRFLKVRTEEGRLLYFRFYDPRVWRVYLPTCTRDELAYVFGPVQAYCLESEDGRALVEHTFDGRALRSLELPLAVGPQAAGAAR